MHWQFRTRSHAAELTAGIYNCEGGHGYDPIMAMFARHGAMASFTCSEMTDEEQPAAAASSPQALLMQARTLFVLCNPVSIVAASRKLWQARTQQACVLRYATALCCCLKHACVFHTFLLSLRADAPRALAGALGCCCGRCQGERRECAAAV